jgi:hypothetical protein
LSRDDGADVGCDRAGVVGETKWVWGEEGVKLWAIIMPFHGRIQRNVAPQMGPVLFDEIEVLSYKSLQFV